jgi:hypothetical protein
MKPETDGIIKSPEASELFRIAPIEDLFYIGYTKSDNLTIYEDEETKIKFTVQFRTLTPPEYRDIFEAVGKFQTFGAQEIQEKIEVLARAVVLINEMPLILDEKDREFFKKEYGRDPSTLDQCRYIIGNKIQSIHMIELLYDEYKKFAEETRENFEDIKKKLKNQKSSK